MTQRRGLTQLQVDNIRPDKDAAGKPKRTHKRDYGQQGLYLIVHPTGRKSWAVWYRLLASGTQCKYVLEGFPSLSTARKLARAVLDDVANGKDPAANRRAAKANTVDALFREFLNGHTRRKNGRPIRESTRIETARLLGLKRDPNNPASWIETGKGVLSRWSGRTVQSVSKNDVLTLLRDIAKEAPVSANRTLTALKTFFSFLEKNDLVEKSPCSHIDEPSPEEGRDRVLTDEEIAAFWQAAEADGSAYARMAQLLLLTGCRRDEVRKAPGIEFDASKHVWLIPGERTKNGRNHLVPLSDAALDIVKARLNGKSLLFTTTGETPISGLSRAKLRLHKAMGQMLGQEPPEWRLHDFRHTLKTWMQKVRVPKDVRNAVQNHIDGDMDEHYGHYSFEKEKREVLDAWALYVAEIIAGNAGANVVPLRSAAS